jgi:hypothetical protein
MNLCAEEGKNVMLANKYKNEIPSAAPHGQTVLYNVHIYYVGVGEYIPSF